MFKQEIAHLLYDFALLEQGEPSYRIDDNDTADYREYCALMRDFHESRMRLIYISTPRTCHKGECEATGKIGHVGEFRFIFAGGNV